MFLKNQSQLTQSINCSICSTWETVVDFPRIPPKVRRLPLATRAVRWKRQGGSAPRTDRGDDSRAKAREAGGSLPPSWPNRKTRRTRRTKHGKKPTRKGKKRPLGARQKQQREREILILLLSGAGKRSVRRGPRAPGTCLASLAASPPRRHRRPLCLRRCACTRGICAPGRDSTATTTARGTSWRTGERKGNLTTTWP